VGNEKGIGGGIYKKGKLKRRNFRFEFSMSQLIKLHLDSYMRQQDVFYVSRFAK
jgi:hypothetical protein